LLICTIRGQQTEASIEIRYTREGYVEMGVFGLYERPHIAILVFKYVFFRGKVYKVDGIPRSIFNKRLA
jgi:hypothetical protein